MTPEQLEKLKVIAEYDGWNVSNMEIGENLFTVYSYEYIDCLHPVAMKLLYTETGLKLRNETWRTSIQDKFIEAIQRGCFMPPDEQGVHQDLIDAIYNAIMYIKQNNNE